MIHFAYHTSDYQPIFTCDSSQFSHHISLNEILSLTTRSTWWKHIDALCPTLSCFPYSSAFPLDWPSSTPCHPCTLTTLLPESIREHLVRHSHPPALGFQGRWCHCPALYLMHCLTPNHLCFDWDHPSNNSNYANFQCPKCLQMHNPHRFQLDDGRLFSFGGHLILEFILHGVRWQTELVETVIFQTIYMQPHHHVENLTRMLGQSLL